MTRVHLAIVERRVAQALLQGVKRIETRFYRRRQLPYGNIGPGDTVHFKLSGGGLVGTAQVFAVEELANLTPAALASLRRAYGGSVCAPARYWKSRRHCRYGVLIWLGPLASPPARLPLGRQYGNGWVMVRDT
jgi:hypothetical protein